MSLNQDESAQKNKGFDRNLKKTQFLELLKNREEEMRKQKEDTDTFRDNDEKFYADTANTVTS